MSNVLSNIVLNQTERFFHNFKTCLATCNLEYMLCEMPIWKHAYHALHSCDRWFINPSKYEEPAFHEDGLNSLDIPPSGKALTRKELNNYLCEIQVKISKYLYNLTDKELSEKPKGCEYSRLELVLGQFRHCIVIWGT